MSAASRKARGRQSEHVVAEYLRTWWPYAEAVGAGRPGSDVTGIVGVDWEVKARRALDLPGTLRQLEARHRDGIIPVAVIRPDGYGPALIGQWAAVTPLATMVELLRSGGYS
jgi:hypothetical protein